VLFTFFSIYVYILSFVMIYSCVWLHIDIFDIAPFFFSIRHFCNKRARAVVFSAICSLILLFSLPDVVKKTFKAENTSVEMGLKLYYLFPAGGDNGAVIKECTHVEWKDPIVYSIALCITSSQFSSCLYNGVWWGRLKTIFQQVSWMYVAKVYVV
jgi:hypothetical protein